MDSSPVACSWGPGRIDVFWRDTAGRLIWKFFENGWSREEAFAGLDVASDPAACSWGPGRIDVFWRSSTGRLLHRWYDRGQGWGADALGGNFQGAPAACSWAPGVIDVFVRTSNNQIWHRWWDGRWHDWLQRPEGMTTARPGVTAWGDNRMDIFVPGTDGKLWHGWYSGQPVHTRSDRVTSIWGFIERYRGSDFAARLLNSFACGTLSFGGCSGAMVSPHIFMTASHCGGPGTMGTVSFYRIDQFRNPADDRGQSLSDAYRARTFPWQDSGINTTQEHGDTVLWWVPDGPDGIAPGIKYGYQDVSEGDVDVGARVYSFWQNPALRLPTTLLYSEGEAVAKHEGSWLGKATQYKLWTVGGSSGSTNLGTSGANAHRVVGVTQGGDPESRFVPDASDLLRGYDSDRNRVLDAIDYDWLITRPLQDVYAFRFNTPAEFAKWTAVPAGSGISVGRGYRLNGPPRMRGTPQKTDGFFNHYARFRPNRYYRFALRVTGTPGQVGGRGCYVKFRSDSSGHEVVVGLPVDRGVVVGRAALANHDDYRVILGVDPGTTAEVQALTIVAEGTPFGFATHDERRSWEYGGKCRPTSWGTKGPTSFAGAVVGPTDGVADPLAEVARTLSNPNLAIDDRRYSVRFETLPLRGASAADACWVKWRTATSTAISAQARWPFVANGPAEMHELIVWGTPNATLMFGVNGERAYLLDGLDIQPVP